jgi:hypothetical protein
MTAVHVCVKHCEEAERTFRQSRACGLDYRI